MLFAPHQEKGWRQRIEEDMLKVRGASKQRGPPCVPLGPASSQIKHLCNGNPSMQEVQFTTDIHKGLTEDLGHTGQYSGTTD